MSKRLLSVESPEPTSGVSGLTPSARLLCAAVSGLLGVTAGGCGDEDKDDHGDHEELSDDELSALCQDVVDEAVEEALEDADSGHEDHDSDKHCADLVEDANDECEEKLETAETECSDQLDTAEKDLKTAEEDLTEMSDLCAPWIALPEDKVISDEDKQYTFAELTKMCDEREGYTQIHAMCGSVNACQGFSYGDWGEAAVFTEHSCAGVNGCGGLSCVVPIPEDTDRTGKEVWEAEFEEPGPGTCAGCHGGYYDDEGSWQNDDSYFTVFVEEGSTRTVDNWLDRSAEEQEKVTAFGANYVMPDGTALANMSPYHRVLSRGEIERVVDYIRTLEPAIKVMKTQDPQDP